MNLPLSIRTKIFLVILVPAALLLFLVYLDYRNLSSLGRSAELILAQNYQSIKAAQQVRQHLEANQSLILMNIFQKNEGEIPRLSGTEAQPLLRFLKTNITETGEEPIIEDLLAGYQAYEELCNSFGDSRWTDPGSDERYYRFIALTRDLIRLLNDLVVVNENAMENSERETKELSGRALKYSVGLLALAFLFTVLLSLYLSARLSQPLRLLARTLSDVKEGSGAYPALPVSTQDEIGFLTQEFNRLFERLQVYDQVSADKLTAEKLKVRQAEEAKARFIADLSHQLKTPMTSLAMGIGTLAERGDRLDPEKRRTLLETVQEDCGRLSALINELVDIARLEGMAEPRDKERLEIGTVVTQSLKPLVNQALEKGVRLETDLEPGLPPVALDSFRFPWIITNLVGNAIRYTDKNGRVLLSAKRRGRRLVFVCADTGTGIEKHFLPKIFDRYTQFSEREKSGTIGLGLAIVREIIEQHGGEIVVESEVGQGTTFTFWIPLEPGEGHGRNSAD
ncbi:MAG: HAMP domain-containing sensor histidine kinase [Thermodesulfobacteriota bacterium]